VPLTAAEVKQKARELGADLVNLVACATLDAHPPDPAWPQIPSRISQRMKTCIDYEGHLREAQERIPEETPAKREKLAALRSEAARAAASGLRAHARWIGALPEPDASALE